jgi:8-oxo-dGTP pyrophosphatase MutT (NUDIX family)
MPWSGGVVPPEPSVEYWTAAIRELFEETGVLLAVHQDGSFADDASDPELAECRDALLEDRLTLARLLEDFELRLAGDRMVHFAHWITPIAEPRRYDTRFFLAGMPDARIASADAREMSDAVWLTPVTALARFANGTLPMVFPTVHTLETLAGFDSVQSALDSLRDRPVAPILPRLVRSDRGVSLVVDEGADGR